MCCGIEYIGVESNSTAENIYGCHYDNELIFSWEGEEDRNFNCDNRKFDSERGFNTDFIFWIYVQITGLGFFVLWYF